LAIWSDDDIRSMGDDGQALWHDPRVAEYAAAVAFERAGDLPAAAATYRRVAAIWPARRAEIGYNLASVLARQGRSARATPCFASLADDPAVPAPLRAGAHFHLGRLAEARAAVSAARDHYRAALVILPGHGEARVRLAALAEASRDDTAAPLPPPPRCRRRHDADTPVLVYQMGKVGSTSLATALRTCLPSVEVRSCHALDEATLVRSEAWLAADAGVPAELAAAIAAERHEARAVRARLLAGGPRWRILTLTREPIAHLVSVLFHHHELYARLAGVDGASGVDGVAGLHRFAIDAWRRWHAGGQKALDPARASLFLAHTWFEREFGRVLDVDVRATPPDRRRGYTRLRATRADIVLARFEDLGWAAADVIAAVCGARGIVLPALNRGDDKPSARLYQRFLDRCRFPAPLVDAIYATPYARHFYTDAERAALARRWAASGD
jgi:hypothetical protein